MKKKEIIVLLGSERSGTNFLSNLICSNSSVFLFPPIHFLRHFFNLKDRFKGRENILINSLFEASLVDLKQEVFSRTYSSFIDLIDSVPGEMVLFKEIGSDFVDELEKCGYRVYYLHLVRDPRSVYASRKEFKPLNISLENFIEIWTSDQVSFDSVIQERNGVAIRYEDLLIKKQEELKKIFQKIGLSLMSELKFNDLNELSNFSQAWRNLSQGLTVTSRIETRLKEKEVSYLSSTLINDLARYQYSELFEFDFMGVDVKELSEVEVSRRGNRNEILTNLYNGQIY